MITRPRKTKQNEIVLSREIYLGGHDACARENCVVSWRTGRYFQITMILLYRAILPARTSPICSFIAKRIRQDMIFLTVALKS